MQWLHPGKTGCRNIIEAVRFLMVMLLLSGKN